ncbi:PucR family transcriptional regulator, partial [Dietzia schimae]
DGSPSATAERLFVHVNTVYQRLDRLDQVLGTGWRRGDRALELRLALRLAELRGA